MSDANLTFSDAKEFKRNYCQFLEGGNPRNAKSAMSTSQELERRKLWIGKNLPDDQKVFDVTFNQPRMINNSYQDRTRTKSRRWFVKGPHNDSA